MKKQRDIIQSLLDYRQVFIKKCKDERKKYYMEESRFYRDLRFQDFLNNRSKLYVIEDILGVEETKLDIIIYA